MGKELIFCAARSLREVFEYRVISGLYFPVFGLNTKIYGFSPKTGKYGPEITPYLDTFHKAVTYRSI